MAKKQSGLGKGLGALMLENTTEDMVATNTLPISEIIPNKEQPRKTFDEDALAELAESIKQHGVLQPLLVRLISLHTTSSNQNHTRSRHKLRSATDRLTFP